VDAAGDIVGDADIEGAVLAAGEDVNVVGHCHALTANGSREQVPGRHSGRGDDVTFCPAEE
jgi:hypothetical protein